MKNIYKSVPECSKTNFTLYYSRTIFYHVRIMHMVAPQITFLYGKIKSTCQMWQFECLGIGLMLVLGSARLWICMFSLPLFQNLPPLTSWPHDELTIPHKNHSMQMQPTALSSKWAISQNVEWQCMLYMRIHNHQTLNLTLTLLLNSPLLHMWRDDFWPSWPTPICHTNGTTPKRRHVLLLSDDW